VACYLGGLATLAVALISPLDALGEALFSAHMGQHLALILVAAPLVALGAPLAPLLWALPPGARRQVGRGWRRLRWLGRPGPAWLLHTLALWLWHLPGPYQAALVVPWLHLLEHLSFFGTALAFWWSVLPHGRRGYAVGALACFAGATQGGALGALLTFSGQPWYPVYAPRVGAWGLTPLEDQQLAGLIMWVPASLVYLGAILALLGAWLQAEEQRATPGTPSP